MGCRARRIARIASGWPTSTTPRRWIFTAAMAGGRPTWGRGRSGC